MIYVSYQSSTNNTLYAIYPNGTEKWRYIYKEGASSPTQPYMCLGKQNIYIGGNFEFGGKFCGPRYISVLEDEKLDSYFIGRVKLSKAIGKYAIIFIGAQFGEYETLKDYKFSENFVDFGVKIKI